MEDFFIALPALERWLNSEESCRVVWHAAQLLRARFHEKNSKGFTPLRFIMQLCGFSKAKLFVYYLDLDNMDVYVIIRKLDSNENSLFNHSIPFLHQRSGFKAEDIPDDGIYEYVGPSGCLRASKRLTAEEPGLLAEKRAL
ncbi:hypothetical protein GQ53DRAFT_821491 [Thozetella sp. PMI_491]|nr:hypothetical protein GQ53DRAFT_821491 [Thozetella sp. PMI_491]